MIGNDVVDLALARKESNWKRTGFLDKIFNPKEQKLILNSDTPEIIIWNLWSRKEAAYKIYNRETGIRAFIPLKMDCLFETDFSGKVMCNGMLYYTSTAIDSQSVHTIAVTDEQNFEKIEFLIDETAITKEKGIPCIGKKPVSISEHGRFRRVVTLSDL